MQKKKNSTQKSYCILLAALCLSGCSSAINPWYEKHPQNSQSFDERRIPRENDFIVNGGYKKKKKANPFTSLNSSPVIIGGSNQALVGDLHSKPAPDMQNMDDMPEEESKGESTGSKAKKAGNSITNKLKNFLSMENSSGYFFASLDQSAFEDFDKVEIPEISDEKMKTALSQPTPKLKDIPQIPQEFSKIMEKKSELEKIKQA